MSSYSLYRIFYYSMTYSLAHSIQQSVRQWIDIDGWNHPFAVTLTLKQRIGGDGGISSAAESLTPEIASRNLRHWLNVMNKQVYGSAAQRHGKCLPVLPVLEGGRGKRLHYHLIIDCPRDDLKEVFPAMIVSTWRKTLWGYDQTDVKPCDAGWLNYITKLRDKPDFASSIDWMNTTRH
jgi:hypothetical protein